MSSRGIFICYRHEDAQGEAGRIDDRLRPRYGGDRVFRDVYSTPVGAHFPPHLMRTVAACGVVIVVIGRRWLETLAARLDRQDDWLRAEIRTALASPDTTVVPVLVQGATMPAAEQLPEDIRALSTIAAQELTDIRWEYDIGRLIATVDAAQSGSDSRFHRARTFGRRLPSARIAALSLLVIATLLLGIAAGAALRPVPSPAPDGGPPPHGFGPPPPGPPRGPFLLQSEATGKCAVVRGPRAVEGDCTGGQWRLDDKGGGEWAIVSSGGGCLAAIDGSADVAVASPCTDSAPQRWRLDDLTGGRWRLVSHTGQCLIDGAQLTQAKCVTESESMTWRFPPAFRPDQTLRATWSTSPWEWPPPYTPRS